MLQFIERLLQPRKKPSVKSDQQAKARLSRLQTVCVRTAVQHELRAARDRDETHTQDGSR